MKKFSYQYLKSQGLCTRCEKENDNPKYSMCSTCREKVKAARREKYEYYKRIGFCVRCHENPAEPNRSMCLECLGKEQDKYLRNGGRTNIQKESRKFQYQKMKAERSESGICTRCGKRVADDGKLCIVCKGYSQRYRETRRLDLPRNEWSIHGRCYICGKEGLYPGKHVCPDCYKSRVKALGGLLIIQKGSNVKAKLQTNLCHEGK